MVKRGAGVGGGPKGGEVRGHRRRWRVGGEGRGLTKASLSWSSL